MKFIGFDFEFLVICLSSPQKNFTVGLKCLTVVRSSFSVYAAVKECLLELNIANKIEMIVTIVTDTAAVNTG